MQKRNKRFNRKKRHQIQSFFDFIKNFEYNSKNLLFIVIVMNRRNILDNKLDQAPKTKEAGYDKRLKDPILAKEIEEAFDVPFFIGDSEIIDRFKENYDLFPISQINSLNPGKTLSFEIKREERPTHSKDWERAIGFPLPENEVYSKLGNTLTKNKEKHPEPWTISTYLIFSREIPKEKMEKNKDFSLKLIQVEVPSKNALIMPWLLFYKELKDDEAKKVLKTITL